MRGCTDPRISEEHGLLEDRKTPQTPPKVGENLVEFFSNSIIEDLLVFLDFPEDRSVCSKCVSTAIAGETQEKTRNRHYLVRRG